MFTPVVFFVFSGIVVGLTSVFLNADIMGGIAAAGTPWTVFWTVVDTGGWTVFNNMEVLFVIGLPLGLADHGKERAALEAFVLYMTFNNFVNSILSMFGKRLGSIWLRLQKPVAWRLLPGSKHLIPGLLGQFWSPRLLFTCITSSSIRSCPIGWVCSKAQHLSQWSVSSPCYQWLWSSVGAGHTSNVA